MGNIRRRDGRDPLPRAGLGRSHGYGVLNVGTRGAGAGIARIHGRIAGVGRAVMLRWHADLFAASLHVAFPSDEDFRRLIRALVSFIQPCATTTGASRSAELRQYGQVLYNRVGDDKPFSDSATTMPAMSFGSCWVAGMLDRPSVPARRS